MRTNLIHTTLIYLVILLTERFAISAPVEPVRTLSVCAAIPQVHIDGIIDNCYGELQSTYIFNATGLESDSDFNASFSLCWDPEYLYVYAEITDDVAHNYQWGVGHTWEFDNIEIFLQLDTNTITTSYSNTTIQIRICRGLDKVETPGRADRSDYLYYMGEKSSGGWITEVAVPWTAVLAEGDEPSDFWDYAESIIGFDLSGADSDNSDGDVTVGNRDVQSAWDPDDPDDPDDRTEDQAWNNTSVFGYINFYGCGLDLENNIAKVTARAYPNPALESLRIENLDHSCTINLYSLTGACLLQKKYEPGEIIDISFISPGLYSLVLDGEKSIRFIKQ